MKTGNASRLLRTLPAECSAEDLAYLSEAERSEYAGLIADRRRINSRLRRLHLAAIFRRHLPPTILARYEGLVAEKAQIMARFSGAAASESDGDLHVGWIGKTEAGACDPDILRLREIGHEFNGMIAAAYLKAVVSGTLGATPAAPEPPKQLSA